MSDPSAVLIVPTGTANIASVTAALERAGATVALAPDAAAVRRADRVVLPGVGAFAAAMQRIREDGVADALAERIHAGRATLAVCVGFQLLFEASEESEGVAGLGVLPGKAARFPSTVRVPQIGWNRVEPDPACRMIEAGHAYFANSFRASEAPPDWAVARADHGGPFVAAVERGAVLGCQFHPELSGAWGQALIARWLARSTETAASC